MCLVYLYRKKNGYEIWIGRLNLMTGSSRLHIRKELLKWVIGVTGRGITKIRDFDFGPPLLLIEQN